MFDFASFGLGDMLECSSAVREVAAGAGSMEEAASAICGYLYYHLLDKEAGERALALVRVFATRPFDLLSPDLQAFAANHSGMRERDLRGTNCLVLLASVGDEPAWNDRRCSRQHQALPLVWPGARLKHPILMDLSQSLGLSGRLPKEDNVGVYDVSQARSQLKVAGPKGLLGRHRVRSVLGFGALLPSGAGFVSLLFSRAAVPRPVASAFTAVALGAKLALLPFMDGPVFANDPAPRPAQRTSEAALLRSQLAALEQLLKLREDAVVEQALRLQHVAEQAEHRAAALARSQAALQAREAELVESREHFAHMARTLQSSLLPPCLPKVSGVDVASLYRPAQAVDEPGGDFYDVFETAKHDWAFTLGDVMGKGTEAASLTALARYTMRAAAMRARRPAAVLAALNEAVHRQHPDRFCTATYARLRTEKLPMRVSMASAGHPPPLLVRHCGRVATLSARGLLAGPFEDWHAETLNATLEPGDSVVLYSDGVLDARRGREPFGPGRLAATLEAAAGLSPQGIVTRLGDALASYADCPGDDLTVLAFGPSR